ncbi:MAG: SEL1-like repeat protein [Mariprofundus sp.]
MNARVILSVVTLLVVSGLIYFFVSIAQEGESSSDPLRSGKAALAQRDYDAAVHWFKEAAAQGTAESQYFYAMLYRDGTGVTPDDAEAMRWLRLSATQGYADAQYELGIMLENGRGVQPNASAARSWFEKAAAAGRVGAALHVAVMYAEGRGANRDDAKAMDWAVKAAATGLPEARAFQQQLLNRLTAQATLGDAGAQFVLAMLSRQGDSGMQQGEKWLRQSADNGNVEAQLHLAELLEHSQDRVLLPEAFNWYLKAAKQKSVKAAAAVGALYAMGRGIGQDSSEALRWLRMAADAGNSRAQANLAILHAEQGQDKQAVAWLTKAAQAGVSDAENNLAVMYAQGRGVEADLRKALHHFQKAALTDAMAQYNLALMYARGIGTIQNDEAVADLLKQADKNGNNDAAMLLGLLYDMGRGVVSNHEDAIHWYQQALTHTSADARYNLAVLYYRKGDNKQAFTLFEDAAKAGDPEAQNIIATMYQRGQGRKQSLAQAWVWYEKAAQKKYAPAQFNLANLYRKGEGAAQQDRKAFIWYKKAAENGLAQAQNSLAYMYALGRGGAVDLRRARDWFDRASRQGLVVATQNLGLLAQHKFTFALSNHVIVVQRHAQLLTEKPFNLNRLQLYHEPRLQ